MAKKCKCKEKPEEPGIPEWVVTFGDMMTLLLCFFILLAAFSELKKEREFQRVITAVQESFGYRGGDGTLPIDDPPTKSMLEILEQVALHHKSHTSQSDSTQKGIVGTEAKVKRIREGLMFTLGGNTTFDPESAELKPEAREELRSIANLLAGRTNKIAVRGHADAKVLSPGSPWDDLDELSFARARAVKAFLVRELDIRKDRIYLEARGTTEPIVPRAISASDQQVNRRIELIMMEALVDEFNADANYTDPDNASGR